MNRFATFNFHSDAGHGWLAVKIELLKSMGIADKISRCSYMQGKTAYLEEDCDAGIFLSEYKKQFNKDATISHLPQKNTSVIRNFRSFNLSEGS